MKSVYLPIYIEQIVLNPRIKKILPIKIFRQLFRYSKLLAQIREGLG